MPTAACCNAHSWYASGTLVRERRWKPVERGAEPSSERQWYRNGQPREASEFISGQAGRRGRMTRERELGEAGQVTRDDAVFEDGSHKAYSR